MSALFSLGLKQALQRVQQQLYDNELLFAYLDDVYVVCDPRQERVMFSIWSEMFYFKRSGLTSTSANVNVGTRRAKSRL